MALDEALKTLAETDPRKERVVELRFFGGLTNKEVASGAKFADGIARSPWPIELHSGERPKVEWLLNDVYEIPFGCFVPTKGENILVAGRCLSAEHEAVASARVTAQCFGYGQAIGHAATMAIRDGEDALLVDWLEIEVVNTAGKVSQSPTADR